MKLQWHWRGELKAVKRSHSVKKHNYRKWQVGLWNVASEHTPFSRGSRPLNTPLSVYLFITGLVHTEYTIACGSDPSWSHSSDVYKTTFCLVWKEKDKPCNYRRKAPQLWLSKQQKETERSRVKPVKPAEVESEPCWEFRQQTVVMEMEARPFHSCWSNGEVWKLTALTGVESNLTVHWFQVHKNLLKFLECRRYLNTSGEEKKTV